LKTTCCSSVAVFIKEILFMIVSIRDIASLTTLVLFVSGLSLWVDILRVAV